MKHVTFNETTYTVLIENKDDIEDKSLLWWAYADYIVFRERQVVEYFYGFSLED